MIVSLDIVYRSHFYLQPAFKPEGLLFGIELITNFIGVDTPVRIPTELVLPHISAEQELTLFCEKIALLENYQGLLMTQKIKVWVNINENNVDAILSDRQLITRLSRLPFIEFTVNENFADLNLGSGNLRLRELSQLFPLALANFGAGIATTTSIFDGLFTTVILDKGFILKQINAGSFAPFMLAIIGQLSPSCRALIITGINDEASRLKVNSLGFSAMLGNLWPAVPAESLPELIHPQ